MANSTAPPSIVHPSPSLVDSLVNDVKHQPLCPPPTPATIIHPNYKSPFNTSHTYHVYAYDFNKSTPDHASFESHHRLFNECWFRFGTARFDAPYHAFTFASHRIFSAKWNPAHHTISWSRANTGSVRVPAGSLRFAENKSSFLGNVTDVRGNIITVYGLMTTVYNTRRKRADHDGVPIPGSPWLNYHTFVHGAKPGSGNHTIPIVHLVKEFSDQTLFDLSTSTVVIDQHDGFGTKLRLRRLGRTPPLNLSFDVTFDQDLGTFSGTCVESGFSWVWEGTHAVHISLDRSSSAECSDHAFFEATDDKEALNKWLPLEPEDSSNKAATTHTLSLQELWHMTCIRATTLPNGTIIVEDFVQDASSRLLNKIYMASLPEKTKNEFNLGTQAYKLNGVEEALRIKYNTLNKTSAIPFLALLLDESSSATTDQKKKINIDKINAYFQALGSVAKPETGADPVETAGYKRDDPVFIELQRQYLGQTQDIYGLAYTTNVEHFSDYVKDQATATIWYVKLSAWLQHPAFLAQWAIINSKPDDTVSGPRQLFEYSTQLRLLEFAAYGTVDKYPEAINVLATAAALAHVESVQYTEETAAKAEESFNTTVELSKEQLDQLQQDSNEAYNNAVTAQMVANLMKTGTDFMTLVNNFMRSYKSRALAMGYTEMSSNALAEADQIMDSFYLDNTPLTELETTFGGEAVNNVFEHLMEDEVSVASPSRMQIVRTKLQEIWGGTKRATSVLSSFLKPFVFAGCAAGMIYALSTGTLDPAAMVTVTLGTLALTLDAISSLAASSLGKFFQRTLLSKTESSKIVGQWFTEKGVLVPIEESSMLARIFGKSHAEFMVKRLGPIISIAMLAQSAYELYTAIVSGDYYQIIESSLMLYLAVMDTVVVIIGYAATFASTGSVLAGVGSACGPIGIVIAVVAIIVLVVLEIVKGNNRPPPPDPIGHFLDGELKTAGFQK